MNVRKLNRLEDMINKKLMNLQRSENDSDENILLTKSVLEFILELVDEKLDKSNSSLIASQEDIDNLSCD